MHALTPYLDCIAESEATLIRTLTRGKHPKALIEAPNGKRAMMTLSWSPSDRRGLLNFKRDLRHMLHRLQAAHESEETDA